MRAALSIVVALAALCSTGCATPCDELKAQEIAGSYAFHATEFESLTPSGARLVSADLETTSDQVVLTYEAEDGSRFRATYQVTDKRNVRR